MTTATKQTQRDPVFRNPTAKAITLDMFKAQIEAYQAAYESRIEELAAALRTIKELNRGTGFKGDIDKVIGAALAKAE